MLEMAVQLELVKELEVCRGGEVAMRLAKDLTEAPCSWGMWTAVTE